MDQNGEAKLTWIPAQYRVRVEFPCALCRQLPRPPDDLMERARARLEAEVARGNLAFYRTFTTRMERIWQHLREEPPADRVIVAVTLAAGAPPLPGISVRVPEPGEECPGIGWLNVTAPAEAMADLSFEVFKLTVGYLLRRQGVSRVPDPARIHGALLRAARGETIREFPLYGIPRTMVGKWHRPWRVRVHPRYGGICVIIHDLATVVREKQAGAILARVNHAAAVVGRKTGVSYRVLREHLVRTLRSADRGPEHFGFDLPLILLGGILRAGEEKHISPDTLKLHRQAWSGIREKRRPAAASSVPAAVARPSAPAPRAAPAGKSGKKPSGQGDLPADMEQLAIGLSLLISEDGLHASISDCHENLLLHIRAPEVEFWRALIRAKGIVHGLEEEAIDSIPLRLKEGETLAELVVARGDAGEEGSNPYLHQTAMEKVRGTGGRGILAVCAGDVVAEYRYKKPARPGCDIFGKVVAPADQELPFIKLGEGLRMNGMVIEAEKDGVPEFSQDSIVMKDALVVNHSVNSSSGPLWFDGPVEVHGNVETGARIRANSLHVKGMIEGAQVRVKGDLVVEGGINTGQTGLVQATGDITALYINNSAVRSGGSITVEKSILNSQVVADQQVRVKNESGVIIGGRIFCGELVKTGNLGKDTGASTRLNVGGSVRWLAAFDVRRQRLNRLQEYLEESRKDMQSIRVDDGGLGARGKSEKRAVYVERVKKLRRLIPLMEEHLEKAGREIKWREDARIDIRGTVSANCEIEIGGQPVPLDKPMTRVSIVPRTAEGRQILALHGGGEKAS